MPNDKDKYIEKILREKQDENKRRYGSFKQRLSMAITVLTLMVTLILFIMKDYFGNILFLFDYVKHEPLASISILLIIFLFVILIFYNLFKVISLLFKALEPMALENIDYESLNIITNGDLNKGKKIFFKDLKDSNDANAEQLNEKYTDINQVFMYLLKLLIFIIILILIIFFITIIEQAFIRGAKLLV
jgi:hypothetical protein